MSDIKLWKHQEEGIRRASEMNYFGFFFEVGTGKSATTINAIRHKYNVHGKLLPTLIISPLITLENWKNELLRFSKIPAANIHVLKGTGAKKLSTFRVETARNPNQIFIVNYDALLNDELNEALRKWMPQVLIADESHYVKNPTAKRTKKIMKLADTAMYRYILSGTPILNSPMDIFTQMYILDLGKRFGTKFHFFKLKYFWDVNVGMPSQYHFPKWELRPGSKEEIHKAIDSCTMHVKKSECLDLPPYIRKTLPVELSGDQKKHYEAMKRDFISYVQDKACVATLAITKALRLQQILTGYMPLDDGSEVVFKDNPRIKALEELLENLVDNHKVIVWACFKYNHRQIEDLLKKKEIAYVRLTGEESAEEKFKAMEEFNNGKARVCIGNQSVGIGVNLIASDVTVYYSRNFRLGDDIQSEGRNYRGGSEIHDKVTRIDLVTPGTIDEKILEALASKKEIGADLIKEISFSL